MTKTLPLGPLMGDIDGYTLSAAEREMLQHPYIGGVILFTRNYQSLAQLAALTAELHALREPRLIVAVDQEGGRVQRFQNEFTRLPAAALFAKQGPIEQGMLLAQKAGWLMAAELLAAGVDLSFAPVLDMGGMQSEVIGDRAFDTDPERIINYAEAYMAGMRQAGMAAVGKHFPGHGSVTADSHTAIPYDSRVLTDIETHDLVPFRTLITMGMPAVMTAHVVYTTVDQHPATFSKIWLKDILRRQLQFKGVIFSDDLTMAAAESMGGYPERAVAAQNAGCDMMLVCNNHKGLTLILDQADLSNDIEVQQRLINMQGDCKLNITQLKETDRWQQYSKAIALLTQPN